MQGNGANSSFGWVDWNWATLSSASKCLMIYGALMWLACGVTHIVSLGDSRTLREVGIWIKPMKFMAATALLAWTTVWVTHLANAAVADGRAYKGICLLLFVTSLFEVVYITYQASQGAASHYNTSDRWHAFLFGLMAIGAVGLTASQGWLAWEIWATRGTSPLTVTAWSVITGLAITFILSTISGFMLGGHQPPSGQGLPVVGWHLYRDVRPAHFLGVHAQQIIPIWGVVADQFFGIHSTTALAAGCGLYVLLWGLLTWTGLRA